MGSKFQVWWKWTIEILVIKGDRKKASSKEYLDFILEQLSELEEITYRLMMGEYIVYYRGKIVGGVYDDRFLVKPVKSAIAYMPNAKYELPWWSKGNAIGRWCWQQRIFNRVIQFYV